MVLLLMQLWQTRDPSKFNDGTWWELSSPNASLLALAAFIVIVAVILKVSSHMNHSTPKFPSNIKRSFLLLYDFAAMFA